MKRAPFAVAALFAVAVVFSGCSKSADTSSNASTSGTISSSTSATTDSSGAAATMASSAPDESSSAPAADSSTPDADASAPTNLKSTEGGMSFTQGNKSASYGKGSADDVKASGLPLYSGIDPANTTAIKSSDTDAKTVTVSASTNDDFSKVDDWYAGQLGSDYKASRLNFGPAHITTFKKDVDGGESTVMLTAAKDPKDGKAVVSIMLISKTKP